MKLLFSYLLLSTALSQAQSFVEDYNEKFAAKEPKVGQPLPDATGFDLKGQPFSLSSLNGEVTVIVSGCFT